MRCILAWLVGIRNWGMVGAYCVWRHKRPRSKVCEGKPKDALNLTACGELAESTGQMADTDFELCYNFRHQEMEKEQIYRHE